MKNSRVQHPITDSSSTLWTWVAVGLTGLATLSARAQHHVEYGLNLSLGPNYFEHYETGEQPVGEINHQESIDGYGLVSGVANVGFGVNKARIQLSGTNPENPLSFDYGFASSRYWDSFQFSDPALDGTHGFFDATLYLAGSGSTTLQGQYLSSPDTEFDAFWHAVVSVTVAGVTDSGGNAVQAGYFAGEWLKALDSSTLDYTGDPLNTYQQVVTFEFIYGQPILMDTFLQVDVQFDNQTSMVAGTLDSVIDLGNSAYWGGIRNLRDSHGNTVTSATYVSSSGIDYRAPVIGRPLLQAATSGNQLVLSWSGNFQLQAAPAPEGNFTTIPNAASPYYVPLTEPQKFFRLVLAP